MQLAHSIGRNRALVRREESQSRVSSSSLEVLLPGDAARASLQRFIGATYARVYGARVEHFARRLIGLRGTRGEWVAAVGYTVAHEQALFLEHYLDRPIECEIAASVCAPIDRDRIVEVGNLAAGSPGAARSIIVRMAKLLHSLDLSWVTFTSTRTLLNSFARLQIDLLPLANADPQRLPDGGRSWGSYYATCPRVFAASIPAGFLQLHAARGSD